MFFSHKDYIFVFGKSEVSVIFFYDSGPVRSQTFYRQAFLIFGMALEVEKH